MIAVFQMVVSVPVTKELEEELAIIVLLVTMTLVMEVVKVGFCVIVSLLLPLPGIASYSDDILTSRELSK